MDNTYIQFIDTLIGLRHIKKMTQHDLANACNLPQSSIARIESKKSVPQLNTLLKILNTLDCGLKIIPKNN